MSQVLYHWSYTASRQKFLSLSCNVKAAMIMCLFVLFPDPFLNFFL